MRCGQKSWKKVSAKKLCWCMQSGFQRCKKRVSSGSQSLTYPCIVFVFTYLLKQIMLPDVCDYFWWWLFKKNHGRLKIVFVHVLLSEDMTVFFHLKDSVSAVKLLLTNMGRNVNKDQYQNCNVMPHSADTFLTLLQEKIS